MVSMHLEISMKIKLQCKLLASELKTQKWHDNNAIVGDDECLRQGLYL